MRKGSLWAAAAAASVLLGAALAGCGDGGPAGYAAVGAAGAGPERRPGELVPPEGGVELQRLPGAGARSASAPVAASGAASGSAWGSTSGSGSASAGVSGGAQGSVGGSGSAGGSGTAGSGGSGGGAGAAGGGAGSAGGADSSGGAGASGGGPSGGTGSGGGSATGGATGGGSGGGTSSGTGTSGGSAAGGATGGGSGGGTGGGGTGGGGPAPSPVPPTPAKLSLGTPQRAPADRRWCEQVTVAFRNSGGTPVRSGTVGFATHIIGALGVDWATIHSAQPLPVPIAALSEKRKTYTVCVEAWRVPLGMHVETREVTADWK
jgi:hypothetical protein